MTSAEWVPLILEVLQTEVTRTGKPLPGAKLRGILARKGAIKGLVLPDSVPFVEFLTERVPDLVIVRVKGSDILVLPPERKDLLPAGPEFHLRRDLFDAFTTMARDATPWYDVEKDRAFWRKNDELTLGKAIAIPPASLEGELAKRRGFVEQLAGEDKELVAAALKDALPLRSFSRTVLRRNLLKRWQAYKSHDVKAKLEAWAKENNVAWRDAWLVAPPATTDAGSLVTQTVRHSEDLRAFLSALDRLNNDELKRIQVPLDVVVKLLNQRS